MAERYIRIYSGRRRVGKTYSILQQLQRDESHIYSYFGAFEDTSLNQLHGFRPEASSWEQALLEQNGPLLIDNFPKLLSAQPDIVDIIKRVWTKKEVLQLMLCGSNIAEMADTAHQLGSMVDQETYFRAWSPWFVGDFFPHLPADEQFEIHTCFGGMPYYLHRYDPSQSIMENLRDLIIDPSAPFHEEPRLLLGEELRELRVYFALLRAIAHGYRHLNEISQYCQLTSQAAGRYLDQLIRRHWVQRSVPLTEEANSSRRGAYTITDNLFRFWFRFIHPNLSRLHHGELEAVTHEVASHLEEFVASNFGDACSDWLEHFPEVLPFMPDKVGGWWNANLHLEVMGCNESDVLFGLCRWDDKPPSEADLVALKVYASAIRDFDGHKKHYAIFSKRAAPQPISGCLHWDWDWMTQYARS